MAGDGLDCSFLLSSGGLEKYELARPSIRENSWRRRAFEVPPALDAIGKSQLGVEFGATRSELSDQIRLNKAGSRKRSTVKRPSIQPCQDQVLIFVG